MKKEIYWDLCQRPPTFSDQGPVTFCPFCQALWEAEFKGDGLAWQRTFHAIILLCAVSQIYSENCKEKQSRKILKTCCLAYVKFQPLGTIISMISSIK